MLIQLKVQNLITIQQLELDFSTGTIAITGETGTGKSVLIDAIELALGGRASEQMVRPGQEKADISLTFDTTQLPDARAWLKNFDLDQPTGECIIRRTINKDGRSKSYINGMPTTLQPLRELSELLLTIHGQHEHQSLLKSEHQRDMLDRYAGQPHLVHTVYDFAQQWRARNNELNELRKLSAERQARSEFLKFQLAELNELHLTPDEFKALDVEHKQLAHAGELLQTLNQTLSIIADDEESNLTRLLNQTLHSLESVKQVEPKVAAWLENINNAIIQISDTENDLRRYLEVVDLDPERLEIVEQRLSTLFNLARKHKISPDELFDYQQKLSQELNELENSDERLSALSQELKSIEKNYSAAAEKLSQTRKTAAQRLAAEIAATIRELSLPHAEFAVQLEADLQAKFSPYGLEKIIFLIKTNAGQSMQPLAKIASGGELSRISLAIYIATAEQHIIPTLIFDEVDVGISGGTAEMVGKLLRKLGTTHQVFCITHLPQVASQAHHHLCVKKISDTHSTQTEITMLSAAEKVREIARMLGGVEITQKTLAHAREMLESCE